MAETPVSLYIVMCGDQVQRWVFAAWLERLEERQEEQQHLLTLKAREHYRSVPGAASSPVIKWETESLQCLTL